MEEKDGRESVCERKREGGSVWVIEREGGSERERESV